jgi:ApbE superfamily uncharacterized protein (UPF0280 family)
MGRVESLADRALTSALEAKPSVGPGGPVRVPLDARRWHFQHGPIDLIVEADAPEAVSAAARERGWRRFETVLEELVAELPLLRRPVERATGVRSTVARRMLAACWPHRSRFITPMAAVAGAVADEVLAAMTGGAAGVSKAYVNNGGDIALHLGPGEAFCIGVVAGDLTRHGHRVPLDGRFEVTAAMPVRGVATSGWRGRSWSLGIADSVTVLAADGATADAAATMIANAVDIDHPAIERRRACEVDDNTDLGDRLVTVAVGPLPEDAVGRALARGAAHAQALVDTALIWGAVLALDSRLRVVGGVAALERR